MTATAEVLAPHDLEAEQAVLGSILVDSECLSDVRGIVSPSDFFDDQHRVIFDAMLSIGEGIDQLTVTRELARTRKLEAVGGPAYLSHLVTTLPTSVHARYYSKIVAKTAFQRRLIEASGKVAVLADRGEGDSATIHAQALALLVKLTPDDASAVVGPKEHAEGMVGLLSQRHDHQGDAVAFGYRDLDDLSGGMWPGDLVLVGARPAVGKSQVLLEIALHNAKAGLPVLFCSCEMSLTQLLERELCMGGGLDMRRLRRGELDDDGWRQAQTVVAAASEMPLYFLCGRLTVATIASQARILRQTKGLRLVVVDYVQLLHDRRDSKAGDTLRERIGYVSGSLKSIATDCQLPVLAACQFSRAVEARDGHLPLLSDLKESGTWNRTPTLSYCCIGPSCTARKTPGVNCG